MIFQIISVFVPPVLWLPERSFFTDYVLDQSPADDPWFIKATKDLAVPSREQIKLHISDGVMQRDGQITLHGSYHAKPEIEIRTYST